MYSQSRNVAVVYERTRFVKVELSDANLDGN